MMVRICPSMSVHTRTDAESAGDGRCHREQDFDDQSPFAFGGARIG